MLFSNLIGCKKEIIFLEFKVKIANYWVINFDLKLNIKFILIKTKL